jgi:hypothetical protein
MDMNDFKRIQQLAGILTEDISKTTSNSPSEQTWKLWLKLSDENEIEDYELDTWNHLQVQGFIKELQWIENNKDKYDDEELSNEFSDYLDELYS